MVQFSDIAVDRIDEGRAKKHPDDDLWDVPFLLSQEAPAGWQQIFDSEWRSTPYSSMMREARATARSIILVAPLSEVVEGHLPQVRKVVSTTNEKYKLTLEREEKAAESDESKRQAEQQELDEVARKVWGALHDYG